MGTYYIVSLNEKVRDVVDYLSSKLKQIGFKEDTSNPKYVFAVGGDGTFIEATRKFGIERPIFIGINEGSLGYLQDFLAEDIDTIVYKIKNLCLEVEKQDTLLIKLYIANADVIKVNALNEVRVCGKSQNVIQFSQYVNGEFLFDVHASGITVFGQRGSTGIAKSQGGPILFSSGVIGSILDKPIRNSITPNFIENPLVVGETTLAFGNCKGKFEVFLDNREFKNLESISKIQILISPNSLTKATIGKFKYSVVRRVREKIIGGV